MDNLKLIVFLVIFVQCTFTKGLHNNNRATHIIRFRDMNGNILHGQMDNTTDANVARLIKGNDVFGDLTFSGEQAVVKEILSPLESVPAIYGVGCNYMGHCCRPNEKNCTGPTLANPDVPTIFFKNRKSLNDPYADIFVPFKTNETDFEAELGVVMGSECKDVGLGLQSDPMDCVLGYVALNDVSARWWQTNDNGQWSFSKSFDGHCPIGPQLVTKEALGDGSGLDIKLLLNGVMKQHSNTDQLIFGVRDIIKFISLGTTIEKGTLIATGTPPGTGKGEVQLGDMMEVVIDKIGSIQNVVRKQPPKLINKLVLTE